MAAIALAGNPKLAANIGGEALQEFLKKYIRVGCSALVTCQATEPRSSAHCTEHEGESWNYCQAPVKGQ